MKTKHCNKCKYYQPENQIATTFLNIFDNFKMVNICKKGHKPKHFQPKNIMDYSDGYKRKCKDFKLIGEKEMKEVTIAKFILLCFLLWCLYITIEVVEENRVMLLDRKREIDSLYQENILIRFDFVMHKKECEKWKIK